MVTISSLLPRLVFDETDITDRNYFIENNGGKFQIRRGDDDLGNPANKITIEADAGANGLITLSGGTGGVRADSYFGVNTNPTVNAPVWLNPSSTAVASGSGILATPTIIGADTSPIFGMIIDPVSITATTGGGNVSNVATLALYEPNISKVGVNNITNASTLRVADAPTEGVNNYSIFVDAGDVRFDGGLEVQGSVIMLSALPTSDPTNAGQLWNDSGTLKVSAG